MKWIKKGHIFNVSGEFGWMNSHAQIPTVLVLEDRLRVYFATRPEPTLSTTGFVDLDINDPSKVMYLYDQPILQQGSPGFFDEHGIMPQYVCKHKDQIWMYYCGWSRRENIPYSNWTGLAVSQDNGKTFEKMFDGPVIDRTPYEIFSATGCFIFQNAGVWHMWYASGQSWIKIHGSHEEFYRIKYAQSYDGIHWKRENKDILPSKQEYEPIHRPTVFCLGNRFHMYFCYRGIENFRDQENSYSLGYAWSEDLNIWNRDDDSAGIEKSSSGWDSMMMAYPYIVNVNGRYLMFYNGNGFGKSGFGYAELAED